MKRIYTTGIILAAVAPAFAQMPAADSTKSKNVGLDEVIISANKVEETKKRVAQQVTVIPEADIVRMQAQSTADLISNSTPISVQKSQMGGGSPVLRGFEASRIVLMVDGVRMNNIMYRAGHLQNVVTIDNNSLERLEVLYGPSSTVYGSDALGGVIHVFTKKAGFATGNDFSENVNAFVRYGSVNNEMTGHADFNLGSKRFASFTSVTYSKFDDLKGGKNQNFFYDARYGDRLHYVDRINGKDSLVANSDKSKQIQSGFSQYDIVQKFAFKQNEHITHGLNLQFSNSTNIPRYDRLTDPSATTGLRYAEWYYGPQQRMMAAYDVTRKDELSFFQTSRVILSFQDIVESRHQRSFGKSALAHRVEHANVAGVNIDFQRVVKSHNIRIGLDAQYNTLNSTAREENITTGVEKPLDTRYPGGNNSMHNSAVYGSHTWMINDKFTLVDGMRLGYSELSSTFTDKTFFPLPYESAGQKTPVYSGSLGIIHTHANDLKISLLVSSGFRAPNVDDLAKVFESAKGSIVVPNKDLKPEKTINGELGVTKVFNRKAVWENAIYYTRFFDAIVTDRFSFNGADSIMYDGVKSRVLASQNKRKAYIYGVSSSVTSPLTDNLSLNAGLAYTYGRIETDSMAYPLDHIPPFMARLSVNYTWRKFDAQVFFIYNAAKNTKDYYLNGEDNEQYATKMGMPAWLTANLRVSYKVHKLITLQAGVDNILDTQYRVFASGINAPGRNIFGAIRFHY